MAFGDSSAYMLKDFTLVMKSVTINNKTELTIESNPTEVQRQTGYQGGVVISGEDPPAVTLKYIMANGQHFDDDTFAENTKVEQFDLTSDNDGDADALANLQTRWPVDGAGNKWTFGKRTTSLTPRGETEVTQIIRVGTLGGWID